MSLNDRVRKLLFQTNQAHFGQNGPRTILSFEKALPRTTFAHIDAAPVTKEPLLLFLTLFEIVCTIIALFSWNTIQVRLLDRKDRIRAGKVVLRAVPVRNKLFRVDILVFDRAEGTLGELLF